MTATPTTDITWKYNFNLFVRLRDYFNSRYVELRQLLQKRRTTQARPRTKLVGVAFKLGEKKMKHSPLCVYVLHKTLNLVISRCRCCYCTKILNARAERERVFMLFKPIRWVHVVHFKCTRVFSVNPPIACFAALSLPSPSSLLKIPIEFDDV